MIDFAKTTDNICDCFNDIGNLNLFFLRLQAETGVTLYEHESLIIFDEVQLFPKSKTGHKASCCRWQIQLSGNRFFDINKEKSERYFNSIRRNENTGISYGL